jgi:serine protease AprX
MSVKGGSFHLPLSVVRALADDPEVAYISTDRPVKTSSTDRYLQAIGADYANSMGWTGRGITVALIDSGISYHDDLYQRVVYSQSFVNGESTSDYYGHGTHVAGIIAGDGYDSQYDGYYAVQGVAPDVKLVNLKVLDRNGTSKDSTVIAAIERAIALKNTYNIRVINLSLGRAVFESYAQDPLCQAVEAAYKAGIVVVVAAGNGGRDDSQHTQGYSTITAPANDPYVITVGAADTRGTDTRSDDRVTTYSSKGPTLLDQIAKPDIVAPGNHIISLTDSGSTLWNKYPGNDYYAQTTNSYSYFSLSGTSMAAPIVSGAAALMLQADPTLSPDTVKARMMKTAFKNFSNYYTWYDSTSGTYKTVQHDLFTVGAGYLDVRAALASRDVATASAASPFARMVGNTVEITSNPTLGQPGGTSVVWGNSVIWGNTVWGNSVVWGNTVVNGSSVIWGNSVVWGNATLQGNSVIWGDSVIWGNTVVGDRSVEGLGDPD